MRKYACVLNSLNFTINNCIGGEIHKRYTSYPFPGNVNQKSKIKKKKQAATLQQTIIKNIKMPSKAVVTAVTS